MESQEKSTCNIIEQMKIMNNRLTVICILLAVLLAGTNMAWLLFISQYDFYSYDEIKTITVQSGTDGSAIYQNGEGNQVNGQDCSEEND